jgi:hypothetical protein
VRRAQALGADEEYRILFIQNALDSQQRSIKVLPNPLGPAGLSKYEVAGNSLRLKFNLTEVTQS